MENPIKMDDLGVPLFLETPISIPNTLFWANASYFPDKTLGFCDALMLGNSSKKYSPKWWFDSDLSW